MADERAMHRRVRLQFSMFVPVFRRVELNGRNRIEVRQLRAVTVQLLVETPPLRDCSFTRKSAEDACDDQRSRASS